MSEYQTIEYQVDGAVAVVTLNRPGAMNAFDATMRAELPAALNQAGRDDAIRCVVLTGAGRAFNAGADLREGVDSSVEQMLNTEYRPTFDAIFNMQKPVISAVNGFAAGIGLSVALACDLTVMADNAFLLSPFAAISLVPDGGACWLLVQQLGYKRAYEMAVEGERLGAQQAFDAGLVNRVVPADQLLDSARAWAAHLATKAPLSLAATKRAMRLATSGGFDEVFRLEAVLQGRCVVSEDTTEAVSAFLEKREPAAFKGR